MRNQELKAALSSKWDQVVARTQTVGDAMSQPPERVDIHQLRELAMAIKAEADSFAGQFPDLLDGQRQCLDIFVEAMRIRCATVLQVATGMETRDTNALAIAQFLWGESAKKAKMAYAMIQ